MNRLAFIALCCFTAVAFGQDDDITVLTLTRLATGEEALALQIA